MEKIPCIFGHGFSDHVVIEENGFQGCRCPACGLIYISPRPSENLGNRHDEASRPDFNLGEELTARAHFDAIYNRHPAYHSIGEAPLSLLEIGCGSGHFLKIAQQAGLEACGVELNSSQAQHVQQRLGIPCETKPFSRQTFGDKKFDLIFHSDVTGRFHDPIGNFTAMRDKLTPHGQLIFETDNGADIDPRYYKFIPAWQYPERLFSFGESSLRELLQRAGFSRIQIISWSTLPQLALLRALPKSRKKIKTAHLPNHTGTEVAPRRLLHSALARTLHFTRFTLGAFSSNRRVPRTLLVWAMK